jgi:hypothetical protein
VAEALEATDTNAIFFLLFALVCNITNFFSTFFKKTTTINAGYKIFAYQKVAFRILSKTPSIILFKVKISTISK